ncbi:hypothetical protein HCJ13_00390 [Listeria booriae]|uniref:hypothetical protein n=1 Tax=Listeria booriae TaxID=1552123 RepID=UPI0016236697|nr:hypothetical protein [Listeria booriae]MBC1290945.1 hypothetical protein [Listeria booriae]MBC1502789.1 hypothetical protein [Listeria booriae]MBC1648643.1 hypothetical protein [Listeria booriae]
MRSDVLSFCLRSVSKAFGDILEKINDDSIPVIAKLENGKAISWFTYDDFKQWKSLEDWLR